MDRELLYIFFQTNSNVSPLCVSENLHLSEEVLILKSKLGETEQHNLGITVNAIDIPKSPNENCITIVENIGIITNTEFWVFEAYRV